METCKGLAKNVRLMRRLAGLTIYLSLISTMFSPFSNNSLALVRVLERISLILALVVLPQVIQINFGGVPY